VLDDSTLLLVRESAGGPTLLTVVRLRGGGRVDVEALTGVSFEVLLTSEDPQFATDPTPIRIELVDGPSVVQFERPGAIVLRTNLE
jgi:hypothetical protein